VVSTDPVPLHHAGEPIHHVEEGKRQRLRELVFGLEDGLVSTMGVITGIASGTGLRVVVILSGLVVIFVEALSMAAGSFLSSKSEAELEKKMLEEELHEIRTEPEKERRELMEYYEQRGFSGPEASMITERFMADEGLLLEEMSHRELGIHPQRTENPLRNASVMWVAYMMGGIVPLIPYLLFDVARSTIVLSVGVTALALFLVGAAKGRVVGLGRARSGLEMALIGMGAGAIGYAVGAVAGHLLGLSALH
jgi:vacuolar iron transporter family protein